MTWPSLKRQLIHQLLPWGQIQGLSLPQKFTNIAPLPSWCVLVELGVLGLWGAIEWPWNGVAEQISSCSPAPSASGRAAPVMLCLFALTCLEHMAIDLLVLEKKRSAWIDCGWSFKMHPITLLCSKGSRPYKVCICSASFIVCTYM